MTVRLWKLVPLVVVAVAAGIGAGSPPGTANAGGGCRGVPTTAATGDQVRMTGHACFEPTVLYAEPGTKVTWTNESSDVHDVAGANTEWGNYNEIRTGGTTSFSFDEPGTYPYYCFLHPGMVGAIVIGDGRSVSGANGAAVESVAAPVSQSSRPQPAVGQESTGAAVIPAADEGPSPLVFALLGGVTGAAAVGLAFGAKELRRGR